ncbi:MAG: AMP-binding protein, partial [bacterium]|nr:AMP-binding protein [bacterium]
MQTGYISTKAKAASLQNIKEREYWTVRFGEEWEASRFPYQIGKENRPGAKEFETLGFSLPGTVTSQLQQRSKGSGHVIHIYLAAVLAILLDKYTYSHRNDITLGTPVYKQEKEEEFINTVLPLRLQWREGTTFKELLRQVKQVLVEGMRHQNYPVETLPEILEIPYREGDDFPLFDVTMLLENIQTKDYLRHIQHNMTLSFRQEKEGLEGEVEYNSVLFGETFIRRITRHMTKLLEEALQNLDTVIRELEVLTVEEKETLLEELNNEDAQYPRDKTINRKFEEQAAKRPENIALIQDTENRTGQAASPRTLTYRQLNEKANHLAGKLIERGVKPGDITAIRVERTIETIAAMIAILKTGAAYLPIDPEYPQERINYMLKDSNAGVLLVDGKSEIRKSKSETKPNNQKSNDPKSNNHPSSSFPNNQY